MKFPVFFISAFLAVQPVCAKVLLGIDVLEKNGFQSLRGKRVGLITNHTGMDSRGRSTLDILHTAPGFKLVKLFSPEHGIRGDAEHGQLISDGKDAKTGLPVLSLYGKTKRPTADMLQGLDALVFDIQDIGTRFYTYTATLACALEEAAKAGIEFIVLDRPNPITGTIVEGEPLDPSIKHFTAYLQVPVRHGMTAGEIANWHNKTAGLNAKLTVVKMEGWKRGMEWEDTGLKFRPTSPNIRTVTAAILYPGIGGFEATNVSVGRGTSEPFEILGAPWIEGKELIERLKFMSIPGFEFRSTTFKPKADLYKGEKCRGVKVILKDRNAARPVDLFVHVFRVLTDLYPDDFKPRWDEVARVTGGAQFKDRIELGQSAETVTVQIREAARKFEEARGPYLLYKEDKSPVEFR